MRDKIDIEDILKVVKGGLVLSGFFYLCYLIDPTESIANVLGLFCASVGYTWLLIVISIIYSVIKFKKGYYVIERDECGEVKYRPYCYKYIGNFVIEKEALWNDFYSTEENAYERIKKIKADKAEEEKQRKCKTTYKIKDYD